MIDKKNIINFLDTLNDNIQTNINVENYFILPKSTQYNLLLSVYKIILNFNKNIFDNLQLIQINYSYNIKNENYELASILNEIIINYDSFKNTNLEPKKIIVVNKLEDDEW